MKAVVTGGAGFIGSHLVDQLLKLNFKVTVIDNFSTGNRQNLKHLSSEIEVIEADLSRPTEEWVHFVKNADYVYHLASLADIVPSIERPIDYYNANVTATINVLQNLGNNLKKFLYAGSSSCYGISKQVPTSEDADIDTEYPYALTKRLGEEIALHWAKVYKIPVVSTRFFNVYGTRSRTNGTYGAVFGVFLAQKLAGKPFTVVGDGNQLRDFTYVTDVCEGILKASFSRYSNEIFNIGSGNPQSINRLVELLGGDVVHIPKRPGEPDITHADISKAQKLLGYNPVIPFEEGVKIILENIDYWSAAPVWTPESIKGATSSWFKNLNSN